MQKAEARVAKNTLFLYARMLLILLINLYTSRVILKTLGFEDYGIYNVVGGLVALFAFMNSSLSGAASRFIAYSIGEEKGHPKSVFSTLLTIHCIVAVVLVLLCETVGILFFDKLVIPESRIFAAKATFHISVAATAISVLRIPYNASIIAHEDMKVFAYVSVVEVILKLAIVFLLNVIMYDKLITYSWLYLAIVILISLIYAVYCVRSYSDALTFPGFEKGKFKQILSYFSWDLYGNLSVAANAQGTNIILNLFGGVVVNSACAIANQVRGAIYGFASNFMLAMNPQIVKNYAARDLDQMNSLMKRGGLLSFVLLWFFSLPLMLEVDFVLKAWLDDVPANTSYFVILSLVFALIQTMYSSINIGIHATGRIKYLSFIGGSILMASVLISYFLLRTQDNLLIPFISNIFAVLVSAVVNLYILKYEMNEFRVKEYFRDVYLKCLLIVILTCPIPLIFRIVMEPSVLRFFIVGSTSVLSVLISAFYLLLDGTERKTVLSKIFKKTSANA